MSEFTIARVKVDGRETLPEIYQEYVIKKDGLVIGELKSAYRPKNAGGRAWCGTLFTNEFPGRVSYYAKNKKEVLEWFKTGKMLR